MERRNFLKLAGALGALAVAPIPAPQSKADVEQVIMAKDDGKRMCLNCGHHERRTGALVCSPLCAMWEAKGLIAKLGSARWNSLRMESIVSSWAQTEEDLHHWMQAQS